MEPDLKLISCDIHNVSGLGKAIDHVVMTLNRVLIPCGLLGTTQQQNMISYQIYVHSVFT